MNSRTTSTTRLALLSLLLTACGTTMNAVRDAPRVSLTATPTVLNGAGTITLTAEASDDHAVTKVEFHHGTTKLGEDTTAPYEATAEITDPQDGTRTYTATAHDDAGNKTSVTATVHIDMVAPTLSLTASETNVTNPRTVTFTASATDERGVARVEFYEGATKVGEDSTAPYTHQRAYGFADNGTRAITAKVTDIVGNTTERSASVNVTIIDANELNDSAQTATTVTVGTPVELAAITGHARDYDWYRLDLTSGDQILIRALASAHAGSTLDPVMTLHAADGSILEYDDDTGGGVDAEIRFNALDTGVYYLSVTSFRIRDDQSASDGASTNLYDLEVTFR